MSFIRDVTQATSHASGTPVTSDSSPTSLKIKGFCVKCQKLTHAAPLRCEHHSHLKCRRTATACPKCDVQVLHATAKDPSVCGKKTLQVKTKLDGTTARFTCGKNGDQIVTVHQTDAWGSTTILRRIKKDKVHEFLTGSPSRGRSQVMSKVTQGAARILPSAVVPGQWPRTAEPHLEDSPFNLGKAMMTFLKQIL